MCFFPAVSLSEFRVQLRQRLQSQPLRSVSGDDLDQACALINDCDRFIEALALLYTRHQDDKEAAAALQEEVLAFAEVSLPFKNAQLASVLCLVSH
jgi:hypothetical protein